MTPLTRPLFLSLFLTRAVLCPAPCTSQSTSQSLPLLRACLVASTTTWTVSRSVESFKFAPSACPTVTSDDVDNGWSGPGHCTVFERRRLASCARQRTWYYVVQHAVLGHRPVAVVQDIDVCAGRADRWGIGL